MAEEKAKTGGEKPDSEKTALGGVEVEVSMPKMWRWDRAMLWLTYFIVVLSAVSFGVFAWAGDWMRASYEASVAIWSFLAARHLRRAVRAEQDRIRAIAVACAAIDFSIDFGKRTIDLLNGKPNEESKADAPDSGTAAAPQP